MNTTRIGTEFENKVFEYFSSLLNKDELSPASKRHSRIFLHKKYPTIATNRHIDFDIAIETYNPHMGSSEWSSLIVIECKCYNHKVEVGDLDEFQGKLHKVSDSGIKGIMVTSIGFSQNIIAQAQKSHIGLVVFSDNDAKWLVSRNNNYKPENLMQILQGRNRVGILPVAYANSHFYNILDLLKEWGTEISNTNVVNIPYLKNDSIQEHCENLIKEVNPISGDIAGEILFKKFPQFRITFADLPIGILGTLSLQGNLITLSNEIINDVHRRNFTLAHETGHLCLHRDFLSKYLGDIQEYDERTVATFPDEIVKRMEMQANLFASYLLMPQSRFMSEIYRLFTKFSITQGRLYLDYQSCNQRNVNTILGTLSSRFNVSKEAAKMRLLNAGLLIIENRNVPRRIGNLFR